MEILIRKEIKDVHEIVGVGIFEYNGAKYSVEYDYSDILDRNAGNGYLNYTSLKRNYYTRYREVGEDGMTTDDFESLSEIEKYLTDNEYEYVLVGYYEHGGISLYREVNGGASDWDSGIFGILWIKKGTMKEWQEYIDDFIDDWNKYCNGEMIDIRKYDDEGLVNSCVSCCIEDFYEVLSDM